jgi:hypothetical protein
VPALITPNDSFTFSLHFIEKAMTTRFVLLFLLCHFFVKAAAPANDNYTSRILVTASSYSLTTTNAEATVQSGEGILGGIMGATIWWQWTAPSAGWVKFDTVGSEIDTVIKVNSGTGLNGTLFGYNDESPDEPGASSLTFQVTAGQVLYIAVGGYDYGDGAEEGVVQFNINTGNAVRPEVWIAALSSSSFTPSSVNVTSAASSSVYSVTVAGATGARGSIGDFYLQFSNGEYSNLLGSPSAGYIVGTQPATLSIPVPRYVQGGTMRPVFTLVTEDADIYEWGNALSGSPYLVAMPTLTVTNTGQVDSSPPVMTTFTMTNRNANVNSGSVNLNLSMTVTDNLSGVGQVNVWLLHPGADIIRRVLMTRTAGTVTNGIWTGTLTVPLEFPTAEYELTVELLDQSLNYFYYASDGDDSLPGGDVLINVVGGGSYWLWAYETIANDSLVGISLDPNGDGIDNLSCFAYDIDPLGAWNPYLPEVVLGEESGLLEMGYWRRKVAPGLSYIPQFSDDLVTWTDFTGAQSEEDYVDWTYNSLTDSASSLGKPRRYARMKLSYTDP